MDNEYVKVLKHAPGLDLTGTRKLSELLNFEVSSFATSNIVKFGCYKGFSLPIWESTGATAEQQIYIKMRVPDQWDGKGAATIKLLFALGGTEATPAACQFRCIYESGQSGGLANATLSSADSGDIPVVAGSLATYSLYESKIEIPSTSFAAGDHLAGLIKRIASSTGATGAMSNNVIILNGLVQWQVDKIYAEL